jgi:uncharacterized protein (TIGR02996 family)
MSEEQSFLDALAANPADDTTRLVYADWLDERGESAKSEYLRLIVGLVPLYASGGPDPPEAARVHALAEHLPRDWRSAAAGRFAVVLYGCDASHKINTIKLVRELTGFWLAEAKRFVETVPTRFPMRTTLESALGLRDHLRRGGPSVRVEVHPDDLDELPRLGFYRVSAYIAHPNWHLDQETAAVPEEATAAFVGFLAATGIPPERTAEFARSGNDVVVADDLEPSQALRRIDELNALLPPPDKDRGWDIALCTSYQLLPPLPAP